MTETMRMIPSHTHTLFLGLALATLLVACEQNPQDHGDAEGSYGRFKHARDSRSLDEKIEELEAVGYLSGTQAAPAQKGVTIHDPPSTQPGLNLYLSGHQPSATLINMEGEVLHEWSFPFEKAFPRFPAEKMEKSHMRQYWRRAHLLEGGDLLAIFEGHAMLKLSPDSELLWTYEGKPHHDLEVAKNGDIYVLTRTAHVLPRINPTEPVLEDYVTVLDAQGNEKKQVSILAAFENSGFAHFLKPMKNTGDLLHTNTIERLDGSLEQRIPAFKAGNVLISCLKTNTLAVIDLDQEQVVWAVTGSWVRQHQPTVLENGNLMVFDNLGGSPAHGKSRVLEMDPVSRRVQWMYEGSADHPFQSDSCGSAARLPNGNTLVVESDYGRAFEVTSDGKIVWEYLNPNRAGAHEELIATLFDLVRISANEPMKWIR